jgi:hypothetical protein
LFFFLLYFFHSPLFLPLFASPSLLTFYPRYTNPTWSALKTAATAVPESPRNSPPPRQLTRLGLAGNKIPRPEIFSDLAAFLQNVAPALTDLDLSATSLPLSHYPTRALFAATPSLVRLELADNEFGSLLYLSISISLSSYLPISLFSIFLSSIFLPILQSSYLLSSFSLLLFYLSKISTYNKYL